MHRHKGNLFVMWRSHLSRFDSIEMWTYRRCLIRSDQNLLGLIAADHGILLFFKFRYDMLRVHAFGSDLSRFDTICLFHVIQSVTIESPDQTKSSAFGYDNP